MKKVNDTRFITAGMVCKRYSISRQSLYRWENDPDLNFPHARHIGSRKYWLLSELEAFEQSEDRFKPLAAPQCGEAA